MSRALAVVRANLNAAVFLVGFGAWTAGIAAWSRPAALIAAGLLLMAIAVWPYLRRRKT